ncbi:MAG: SMP-30/gluconolactonase/LRE family protein [Rubrivivax sp.]
MSFERVGQTQSSVGESPLWAPAEQALLWVDIEGRRIHRHDPLSGLDQSWEVPERPACLALHPAGGVVCALESRVVHLQLQGGGHLEAAPIATVDHPVAGMRFNDGRCDRRGAFWVGSMVMNMGLVSPVGQLFRLTGDRIDPALAVVAVPPLVVPNGLAFSPDNRTMYLSDSHPSVQRIWCFDHDPEDGRLGSARLFVDMKLHPGRPDGAAVDEDGCYWICANDAGLLHRFTPAGRLDQSITVPVSKPSMCAFGGAQLDELYVTSIRPASLATSFPETALAAEAALAGATFVCRPGVRGLPEAPFRTAAAA